MIIIKELEMIGLVKTILIKLVMNCIKIIIMMENNSGKNRGKFSIITATENDHYHGYDLNICNDDRCILMTANMRVNMCLLFLLMIRMSNNHSGITNISGTIKCISVSEICTCINQQT